MKRQFYKQQRYSDKLKTWEWEEFRERQLELAEHMCWVCGTRDRLNVHHLTYHSGEPWEYSDDQVRVLCEECHRAIHVVADDIWIESLRFQPHELELILKHLKRIDKPESPNLMALLKSLRKDFVKYSDP
jgi:hypothetical protein